MTIIERALAAYKLKHGRKLNAGEAFIIKYNNCAMYISHQPNHGDRSVLDCKLVQDVIEIDESIDGIFEAKK